MRNIILFGLVAIAFVPVIHIAPWFAPALWSNTIAFKIIMSALLFLALWQFLFRNREFVLPVMTVPAKRVIIALGALMGVFFLSSVFSLDSAFSFWGDPFRSWGFANYLLYGLFALLLFLYIKGQKEWNILFGTAVAVGIGVILVALAQLTGSFAEVITAQVSRPGSVFGNPLYISIYLVTLFFVILSFIFSTSRRNVKYLLLGILAFFFFGILLTISRSAFLALAVGGFFFLWAFPQKMRLLKGAAVALVLVAVAIVSIANTIPRPGFIESNSLLSSTWSRMNVQNAVGDSRIEAWGIISKATLDRPILGYGMYNTSIAFDRYFVPVDAEYIPSHGSDSWWDTSHNIFLDIIAGAGYLGLAVFLWFTGTLFWLLRKVKKKVPEYALHAHGVQTGLVAYFASTFFIFNVFPTYIIFFLLVGYALYLSTKLPNERLEGWNGQSLFRRLYPYKVLILAVALIILSFFSWQYAVKPYQAQFDIEISKLHMGNERCVEAADSMERAFQKGSTFLDFHIRIQYNNLLVDCAEELPLGKDELISKRYALLKEASLVRPNFTRTWFWFAQVGIEALADEEFEGRDMIEREVFEAFERAEELSPGRWQTRGIWATASLNAGRHEEALEQAKACLELAPDAPACWLVLIASNVYLGNFDEAEDLFQEAEDVFQEVEEDEKPLDSVLSLQTLIDAYISHETFHPRLPSLYEKLIAQEPENLQRYASLAFVYRELGEYEKAREWAMRIIEKNPEARGEVEPFLRTLP